MSKLKSKIFTSSSSSFTQTNIDSYFRPSDIYYKLADKEMDSHIDIKNCEICNISPKNLDHTVLLCDVCDDAYHMKCINLKVLPKEEEDWYCPLCIPELKKQKERKDLLLKQKDKELKNKPKNNVINFVSRKNPLTPGLTYAEAVIRKKLLMEKENVSCNTTIIQPGSSKNKKQENTSDVPDEIIIPGDVIESLNIKSTEEIIINKPVNAKSDEIHPSLIALTLPLPDEIINGKKFTQPKGKAAFRLPRISKNSLEYKSSLLNALISKNMIFSDNLVYPEETGKELNNASLEPTVQKLSALNTKTFLKFKQLSNLGYYGTVNVVLHPKEGFIVVAAENIPDCTLICEYTGIVDNTRAHLFDDESDDIMDLLITPRSKTSLVIWPSKCGNIARFLSGVNNWSQEKALSPNVRSARFSINGEVRVILYAKRNIKAGEILRYDYNALKEMQYDTEHFV